MLIDEFMPDYDFSEKHETSVRASAEKVFAAVNSTDLRDSWIIRGLFTLRGLGFSRVGKTLTLREMTKDGFAILGERPDEKIVLGLAGKFWKPTGDLQKVDAETFRDFETKGFAKAAWNFALTETGAKGEICLTTETRILCMDDESLASFRFYWNFIKPFSSWIRLEMLRLIKQKAESEN